MHEIFLLDS